MRTEIIIGKPFEEWQVDFTLFFESEEECNEAIKKIKECLKDYELPDRLKGKFINY